MGNWQLEVFRMGVYIFFPVATFYAYHQVDWFEEKYKALQRKTRTKEIIANDKEMAEFAQAMIELKEKKFAKDLAKFQAKQESIAGEAKQS